MKTTKNFKFDNPDTEHILELKKKSCPCNLFLIPAGMSLLFIAVLLFFYF